MTQTISIHWLSRKILIILVIVAFLFTLLEIWAVNRLATFGQQINSLEITKSSLVLENQLLKNQIAQKASLSEIEKKTKDMGFVQTQKFVYIHQPNLASR